MSKLDKKIVLQNKIYYHNFVERQSLHFYSVVACTRNQCHILISRAFLHINHEMIEISLVNLSTSEIIQKERCNALTPPPP